MNKRAKIQAIKGMKDILPGESNAWLKVESICHRVFSRRGYSQIRTPIIESTALFSRSIGEETDIVSKEMYTFDDRNGDSLTLRPEGTASSVRAGIEHGLFYNQQQRMWYCGPMFRHERPQKGRYRQFHQVGAEAYGWASADVEAEVLSMLAELFSELGLKHTTLYINSLGDSRSRQTFRENLVDYLSDHYDSLDEDSQRRLKTNPLRILDSKNPQVKEIVQQAPNILDFLSDSSREHFEELQTYLTALDIPYEIDPLLVRGLDYYNDTVFEWINHGYGAQATVCGGGRYDNMVEQLGGQATPAFGFGMGLERLIEMLLEQENSDLEQSEVADVFIVSMGAKARVMALIMQSQLSKSGVSVLCHLGEGSMKNQFKRADKSRAKLAVIIGEEEAEDQTASVKMLRRELATNDDFLKQHLIPQDQVPNFVTNLLDSL